MMIVRRNTLYTFKEVRVENNIEIFIHTHIHDDDHKPAMRAYNRRGISTYFSRVKLSCANGMIMLIAVSQLDS